MIKRTDTSKYSFDEIIWLFDKEQLDVILVEGFHRLVAKREDLAKIVGLLSLKGNIGVVNVATGKSKSFLDMVGLLEEVSNKKFKIIRKKRIGKSFDQRFNISKLRNSLTGLEFTDTEEALRQTFSAHG